MGNHKRPRPKYKLGGSGGSGGSGQKHRRRLLLFALVVALTTLSLWVIGELEAKRLFAKLTEFAAVVYADDILALFHGAESGGA